MPTNEERFAALNLTLPPAPKAMAVYRPALRVGNHLYVSGHGPLMPDKSYILGRAGDNLTADEAKGAAKQVALAVLATLRAELGSLDKVVRLVKTLGLVQCTDDFTQQPAVMNGWSELMREVFGEEAGVGVRSALGTNALPNGMAVEVEAIFEIKD